MGTRRKSGEAPVVYVALASHASYFASGVHGRGIYPDDNHRGGGYRVRPALEVVTPSTPFMAWRGRWGASSSSPAAPRRQSKWGDPAGFHAAATACPVTATASRAGSRVRAPRIVARRSAGVVEVHYRVRAQSLLLSVTRADAPDVTTTRRISPRRSGTVRLAAPAGPLVVQASAFARDGSRSRVITVPLP